MNQIDRLIYEYIMEFLSEQKSEIIDCDIEDKYIVGICLQEIYGYKNVALTRHLKCPPLDEQTELPDEFEELIGVSDSTISRKRNKLEANNENKLQKIRELSERIVLMLYTEGVNLPDKIIESHNLGNPQNLTEPNIDVATRQKAVRNWSKIFINEIISPLTFDRTNPQYEYRRFIGLCAHVALQDIAPNDAARTAEYLYDNSKVPEGGSLTDYIREGFETDEERWLPKETIDELNSSQSENSNIEKLTDFLPNHGGNETKRGNKSDISNNTSQSGTERLDKYLSKELTNQFVECYRNFFELADNLGMLKDSYPIAVDKTGIPTTSDGGKESPLTPRSSSNTSSGKRGDNSWSFQFIGIIDADAPFVWAPSPIYNRTELQIRLAKQLHTLTNLTSYSPDFLFADRGYYKVDCVSVCREYLDDNWAINAKKIGDIKALYEVARKGEVVKDTETIDFGTLEEDPNAFVYPNSNHPIEDQVGQEKFTDVNELEENVGKKFTDDTEHKTHTAYLTDKNLSRDEIRKIQVLYHIRDSIEPPFGLIKDIMLPYSESGNPVVRHYFMAMAGLFYNMHALVSRSLSPQYNIPLNISAKELLTGIRDVCFD